MGDIMGTADCVKKRQAGRHNGDGSGKQRDSSGALIPSFHEIELLLLL
jgi:hypothetical protein